LFDLLLLLLLRSRRQQRRVSASALFDLPMGSSIVDAHTHAEAPARYRLPVPRVPRVGLMDHDELDGGERHESIPDRRRLQ
jgi:hypothetical protein